MTSASQTPLRDPDAPTLPAAPGPEGAFDAITELFLGGSAEPSSARPAPGPAPGAGRASLEAVVLGHLPVFAGAWVGEYARRVALDAGEPVALARLSPGEARIDVYCAGDTPRANSAAEAVRLAAGIARRWVIRAGDAEEAHLAGLPRLDRLTVLSGSDDAAIVAAYRVLKGLAGAGAAREVGVALMGTPPSRAREIEEKLAAVSETFLGTPIRVVASIERISGGESATLFRGPSDLTPESLAALIDASRAETRAPAAAGARRVAGGPPTARGPSLASLVGGLTGLVPRCPFAPDVELATDAAGELHLLADGEAGEEGALARLMAAGAWAKQNRTLLTMAVAGVRLDGAEPTMHLLTPRPAEVRRLLDSSLRLHALRWVEAGAQRVPVCAPLN